MSAVDDAALAIVVFGTLLTVQRAIALLYARRTAEALTKLASANEFELRQRRLDYAVTTAISYFDERTHKYLRGFIREPPKGGAEKQALAVKLARELAPDGLRDYTDKAIAVVVDARVQDRRAFPSGHLSIPPPSLPPGHLSIPPPSLPPGPALPTPIPPRRSS